jgi:hypothetical protein
MEFDICLLSIRNLVVSGDGERGGLEISRKTPFE